MLCLAQKALDDRAHSRLGKRAGIFGRLMHCRRLVQDYELLFEASETFSYLAMIRMMVGHFA
jgi:hypothetical protein